MINSFMIIFKLVIYVAVFTIPYVLLILFFLIVRFTAFYCSYFVVDLRTKKVLGFWVATKEMVFFYLIIDVNVKKLIA